ncbi:MAG: CO dehydrogenase/acetyl-CoA synthase complex subunit epsilon [Dehalococcoidia bacterium]|nr:CO dehydrogenase/acetyl-CoA synthase complex subunit epsilon [Dehalococcoidia bacterium]
MIGNLPYHRVNVLTGTRAARTIADASEYAHLIKSAGRPLLVVGPGALTGTLNGKPVIEYALEIAGILDIPVCATAHTRKKLAELGLDPASSYDIMEIINHLKDPAWPGTRKEGNHDLVIFIGIRTDLAGQALSTLKHYARHLQTMTLNKYYFPNASYSLPNMKDGTWKVFIDTLITNLKEKAG